MASRNTQKISGIKTSLQNSQSLISSGIPSLDHILGGGLPIGSIFLIEEDEFAKYSSVMFKYFLSEGIVCNQKLLISTLEYDSKKMVTELPSPTNIDTDSNTKPSNDNTNIDMKIAWRYNSLSMVESSINSGLQFGHYFDLATPMDADTLSKANIVHWNLPNKKDIENISSENRAYNDLLKYIQSEIKNGNYNVLRIGISSLGSPRWLRHQGHIKNEGQPLIEFVYKLRTILRNTQAVAFMTIPTHLFEDKNIVSHIIHSVDGCIRLDSFVGTDRELNSALRDYHGLFYMPKLFSNNRLAAYVPPTLDLAFKLRRKKFVIEKLHLPPELQDSNEREQDDGSSFGCTSVNKRNLDF